MTEVAYIRPDLEPMASPRILSGTSLAHLGGFDDKAPSGGTPVRSNFISWLAASCVVFTTVGCSYLFGPRADDPKPLRIQNAACVKEIPANVKSWLADGQTDIGVSVDCAVKAIDQFTDRVKGQTKSIYTKGELSEFISDMLTAPDSPNAGHTLAETEEILRIKQILFGGANDLVTKDELARFKSLLLRTRPLLIEVTPNIPLLLFAVSSATVDQVTTARNSLSKILDLIAGELEANDDGRPESAFSDLLKSAHKLGLENDSVENWIPLAESVKVLILAGEPNQLRSHEWAPLIRTISKAWNVSLRAKYNFSGNNEILGRDFPIFESSIRESLDLLGAAVDAHGGSIPNETFEKLIAALPAKSLVQIGLSTTTLKNLLPVLFGKLFYGRAYENWQRQSLHFGTEQLARLRAIMTDWMTGQELVNQAMSGQATVAISQVGSRLAARKLDRQLYQDPASFLIAQRAQAQLTLFLSRGRPPAHDDEGRLIVVPRKELPALKKSDLNTLNLYRVILSTVLAGWAHDQVSADNISGLLEAEVQEAYLDFRDVGHDLNYIDIRSNQAGIRTFMENAIFMSSSDGSERMGLQQGVEWLHVVTAGGKLADRVYHQLEESCAVPNRVRDVLGNLKLNPDCFRQRFLKIWASNMPNLPKLVSWVESDGSGERGRAMMVALETAGRSRGASQELVDSSEFRSMIPIMHYLESLFARFDTDQSGDLDSVEIARAFPLLGPVIKKMGNGQANSENMQRTILAYIINYGVLPDTDSMMGKASFLVWMGRYKLGLYTESADRLKILTVIGAFSQAAKRSRVKSISAFHDGISNDLRALIRAKEPGTAAKITELFQCLPPAAQILALDMAGAVDRLAPAGEAITNEIYVAEMKTLIDRDPRLETYCLPF